MSYGGGCYSAIDSSSLLFIIEELIASKRLLSKDELMLRSLSVVSWKPFSFGRRRLLSQLYQFPASPTPMWSSSTLLNPYPKLTAVPSRSLSSRSCSLCRCRQKMRRPIKNIITKMAMMIQTVSIDWLVSFSSDSYYLLERPSLLFFIPMFFGVGSFPFLSASFYSLLANLSFSWSSSCFLNCRSYLYFSVIYFWMSALFICPNPIER